MQYSIKPLTIKLRKSNMLFFALYISMFSTPVLAEANPAAPSFSLKYTNILFTFDENKTGYRQSTTNNSDEEYPLPLNLITFYPASETVSGLDLTYREEESGLALLEKNTTVILHTTIPLTP